MLKCSGLRCKNLVRRKWDGEVHGDPMCGICRTDTMPGYGKGTNVVYFIGCGDFVKIGYTRGRAQLDKRIKELQTGSPHELRLVGWVPGNWRLEQFLHERFDRLHERGEWFRLDDELQEFIDRHKSTA